MKEKRLKETVCGRAVHWISEAGRGRCTGQGVMPAARIQRRIVLYLADQVWWDERAGCETAAGGGSREPPVQETTGRIHSQRGTA